MHRVTGELAHNSDEQVREYVQKALELLDELGVEPELRPIVFERACNLYASKDRLLESIQPGLGALSIPGAKL